MIQPAHPTPPLVIYGAGGHGQVVADAAMAMGLTVLGFLDDAPLPDAETLGAPTPSTTLPRLDVDDPRLNRASIHVAIGNNADRHRLILRLREEGRSFRNVIHPSAAVSPSARLGESVFVGAQAVVNAFATLADGVIVNSAAVVEHHGQLDAAVHLAPTAALAGNVRVGTQTLVGLGRRSFRASRSGTTASSPRGPWSPAPPPTTRPSAGSPPG